MTEQEWDASADPDAMLAAVDKPGNARKLRLFAVALYQRHRRWLKEEHSGEEAKPLSARAWATTLVTSNAAVRPVSRVRNNLHRLCPTPQR